jgi:hypothetical protein
MARQLLARASVVSDFHLYHQAIEREPERRHRDNEDVLALTVLLQSAVFQDSPHSMNRRQHLVKFVMQI